MSPGLIIERARLGPKSFVARSPVEAFEAPGVSPFLSFEGG